MMPRSAWLSAGNNRCPTSCAMVWPSSRRKSSPCRLARFDDAVRQNVRASSLACDEPEYRVAQRLISAQLQLRVPREQEHAQRESTWVRARLRARHPEDPDTNGLVNTRGFSLRHRQIVRLNRGEVVHVRHNGRLAVTRGFLLLDPGPSLTGQNSPGPPHPHEVPEHRSARHAEDRAWNLLSSRRHLVAFRPGAGLLTRIRAANRLREVFRRVQRRSFLSEVAYTQRLRRKHLNRGCVVSSPSSTRDAIAPRLEQGRS